MKFGIHISVILALICSIGVQVGRAQDSKFERSQQPIAEDDRSNKLIKPVFDKASNQTTFFLSGVMPTAEAVGRKVYIASEGTSKTLPSAVLNVVAYFKYPGTDRPKPDLITIAFNAGSHDGYRFSQDREFSIILPSETLNMGTIHLTGQQYEGFKAFGVMRYWETMEMTLSVETYRKIISADSVVFQIGADRGSLTKSHLKFLRAQADKYLK